MPELPNSAPQQLSFGVVQFTYQGAQFAGSDARTKELSRQKAEATLELAKHDFAAAVGKGDRGSTSDAGRIPRGVLEPPIEYVLFTLDKRTVYPTRDRHSARLLDRASKRLSSRAICARSRARRSRTYAHTSGTGELARSGGRTKCKLGSPG